MNFAFSEEQEFLRETARRFLDDKASLDRVRELMESDEVHDASLWQEMAGLGWQAMAIPEEYGGAGYGFLELMVLLEEMGRSVFAAPFLSTVVLGATLVEALGTEEQKKSMLSEIASGSRTVALALSEANGRWDADGIEMVASPDGDAWIINGTKRFVIDGHTADTLLVAVRSPDTSGSDGVTIVAVPSDVDGVTRVKQEAMDQTRPLADITFDDVRLPVSDVIGDAGNGWAALDRALKVAAVALAAEAVGGAQACLDMAVEYAKDRIQFGRPIGSFQAIKHKCADMLVSVESAKSAAYYAAWAVDEDSDELELVAPLAKAYCTEAYFKAAAENIQIHGGIGFTWEHDAHLYFKRAKSIELMFGSPAYHRARLADVLGI